MQTRITKKITVVEVNFSEEEWIMLINRTNVDNSIPAELIHDLVVRNLRRKARKDKKSEEGMRNP